MTNIEEFPLSGRRPTAFDSLVALVPNALEAIPGAVYVCDRSGWLVSYNSEAAALWGRSPNTGANAERFCGSHSLFRLDGTPLDREGCPMADALSTGIPALNAQVIMERPDGSRIAALLNIRVLKDHSGKIQGAVSSFQDISAQRAIDKEIHQKSGELEDFFENGAVGLHIVSGEGIILRANRAELALLGYSADEYVGRHIAEFHVDPPVIGDILHKLSCGEQLDRRPARLRAKDGSIKHVLITSSSRFEHGKFVNTRCFTVDRTHLHEAERARLESEQRLAATYEAATVGIVETDEAGRMLRLNEAMCKILLMPREQLLGMRFLDFTHEEDRNEDATMYARQVRGELGSYSVCKRAVRSDGCIVFVSVRGSAVRDRDGRFLYGVRVIQDVTEATRMEADIRDSERRTRDILEALPAAVYTTDAGGRITFFNRACVDMAGRTPQLGDKWCVTWRLHTIDGAPLPHDQCPMAVALKEGRAVRGVEAIAERPDGTFVPFMPYPTPLLDNDGNLIGAINMLVDITERKQSENRQKTLIDELNHRVKNTLAIVQSLALQTARHSENIDDFNGRFEKRLVGLARAHDLLTIRHWQDAPLEFLARQILEPMAGGANARLTIAGPGVLLTPRIALSLTLALGELATNAAKYGAFSSETGTICFTWNVRNDDARTVLDFTWQESGGPTVKGPTRRGFGTRLIERCVERDLGGALDIVFEPQGIYCRASFVIAGDAEHE